jgi:adenosylhomocysteine nucleosidase
MERTALSLLMLALVGPMTAPPQDPAIATRPLLVQGAMPSETEFLAARLQGARVERVGGWMFWRGTVDGYPVIVSKTLKGMSNAAAVTALAIDRYRPVAIINQGTAGGHTPTLRVYDIVLGTSAVNLGAFKSPRRQAGAGSNTLDWTPLDLMASEGSASGDPNARRIARFAGDRALLAAAVSAKPTYARGQVVEGVIGSSDIWNDELDRIARFRSDFGTTVEDMETASAAQIAALFNVPFLGIRVLSNNATNGGAHDPKTGEACQEFVYHVVKAYVATTLRKAA